MPYGQYSPLLMVARPSVSSAVPLACRLSPLQPGYVMTVWATAVCIVDSSARAHVDTESNMALRLLCCVILRSRTARTRRIGTAPLWCFSTVAAIGNGFCSRTEGAGLNFTVLFIAVCCRRISRSQKRERALWEASAFEKRHKSGFENTKQVTGLGKMCPFIGGSIVVGRWISSRLAAMQFESSHAERGVGSAEWPVTRPATQQGMLKCWPRDSPHPAGRGSSTTMQRADHRTRR
jgi:hypothetical protein